MPVLKEKPTDFKAGITLQSEGPAVFSHCFNNTIKEEVFTLVSKLTALLRICQVVNTNSYYLIFFTFALIQNIKLCAFAFCNVSELKMFILWLQLKILVNINTKNCLQEEVKKDTYINALDGSVTVFLLGVVDKGTLLFKQHLDAVNRPSSERERKGREG